MQFARLLVSVAALASLSGTALAGEDIPLRNWAVRTPRTALTDIGGATVFVAMSPCRIVDTRGGAPYTGGPFTNGVSRNYDLNSAGAPCTGIPAGVSGYSINVTVTNDSGTGFIAVYPTGNPPSPLVSLLNYTTGQAVANATIVPCDASGSITVLNAGGTTDVLVDINGYFTNPVNTGEQLWVAANIGGAAAIVGYNNSATTGSHGVGGYAGAAGTVYGVQGQIGASTLAGSAGVHGIGAATTVASYGVYGETTATPVGSAAVYGYEKDAGADTVHGVGGRTDATGGSAAGVWGYASSAVANAGRFDGAGNAGTFYTYLGTTISAIDYALYNMNATVKCGTIQATTKNFIAPHPDDPSREIVYTSVEAPTSDIYFRGSGRLVDGIAVIQVPEHFRLSARAGSYQTSLTSTGPRHVWVESEGAEGIVVRGAGDTPFHFVVYAERDAIAPQEPVRPNRDFTPEALAKGGDIRQLPEGYRALLVRNGTLNPDLTLNRRTAQRLGWALPAELEAK